MADGYLLTEADRSLLRRLYAADKAGVLNIPHRTHHDKNWEEGKTHHNTDVYIAWPKYSSGIPGLTDGTPPEAGKGLCEIYTINFEGDDEDPKVRRIEEVEDYVYNVGDPIGQEWVMITREKSGQWLAIPKASSTMIIRIELIAEVPDIDGLKAWLCNILSRTSGIPPQTVGKVGTGSGTGTGTYNLGDIYLANVVDAIGCLFDGTESAGDKGYAALLDSFDYRGTGTTDLDTGTGTGPASTTKRYECISLCCPQS